MSSLKLLKYFFIFIALLYILSPWDLIPDALGLLGRVDEIVLIWFLYWRYKRIIENLKQEFQTYYGNKSTTQETSDSEEPQQQETSSFDPYRVLELSPGATKEEIAKQYKVMLKKYHPDRVHHLGEEFHKLAHEKAVEIQKAYEMLK